MRVLQAIIDTCVIVSAMTKDYLEERAQRGSREKLLHALSQVPDNQPEENDKLQ